MPFGAGSSKSAPKCRLCGFPTVDGGVKLSTVDKDKLSLWWAASKKVPLQEEIVREGWCCQSCVSRAKRDYEIVKNEFDCAWWIEKKSDPVALIGVNRDEPTTSKDKGEFLVCKFKHCLMKLRSESLLREHYSLLHMDLNVFIGEKELYQECPLCKTVMDKKFMQSHEKPYSCLLCGATFECRGLRDNHSKRCRIKCDHCACFAAPTRQGMISHLRNTHSLGILKCSGCKRKRFKSKTDLDEHMREKHPQRFNCDLCGMEFCERGSIVKHFNYKHQMASGQQCPHCPETFQWQHEMNEHMRISHRELGGYVNCKECGAQVKEGHLERHLEKRCPKESVPELIKCHVCGMMCKKDLLKIHIFKVHKAKNLTCKFCSTTFSTLLRLEGHFCPGRKKKKCPHCSLEMYLEYWHLHPFEDDCQLCQKVFPCKNLLDQHIESRRFCPWCKQIFCDEPSLQKHMDKKHPSNSQQYCQYWIGLSSDFKCYNCRTYFGTEETLTEHIKKTHPPRRNCELCASSFKDQMKYMTHLRRVHSAIEDNSGMRKVLQWGKEPKDKQSSYSAQIPNRLRCTVCNQFMKSTGEKYLLRHLEKKHPEHRTGCTTTKQIPLQNPTRSKRPREESTAAPLSPPPKRVSKRRTLQEESTSSVPTEEPQTPSQKQVVPAQSSSVKTLFKGLTVKHYKCPYCADFKLRKRRQMENHVVEFHRIGIKGVTCNHCCVEFKTDAARMSHVCDAKVKVACIVCNLFMYEDYKAVHNIVSECNVCNAEFQCETQLLTHQEQVYHCQVCKTRFCKERLLMQHLVDVHKRNDACDELKGLQFAMLGHQCEECSSHFQTDELLKKHLEKRHPKFVACEFCAELFLDSQSLREHYLQSHNFDSSKPPEVTHSSCIPKVTYKVHFVAQRLQYQRLNRGTKVTKKIFQCSLCNEINTTKMEIEKHVLSHSKDYVVCCPVCEFWTPNKKGITAHLRTFHKVSTVETRQLYDWHNLDVETDNNTIKNYLVCPPILFHCGDCPETSETMAALDVHMIAEHNYGRETCGLCRKTHNDFTLLQLHLNLNHKLDLETLKGEVRLKKREFDCGHCHYNFATTADWMEHWEKNHKDSKAYPKNEYACAKCNEECPTRMAASLHAVLAHSRAGLQCTFCNLAFSRSTDLTKHLRTHLNYNFCEVCYLKFTTKEQLVEHMQWNHPQQRRCQICRMVFNDHDEFQKHLESHSQFKKGSFTCSVCKVCADTKAKFDEHIEKHRQDIEEFQTTLKKSKQKNKLIVCKICRIRFGLKSDLVIHVQEHVENLEIWDVTKHKRTLLCRCTVCFAFFYDKAQLDLHIEKQHGQRPEGEIKIVDVNAILHGNTNASVSEEVSVEKPTIPESSDLMVHFLDGFLKVEKMEEDES